MRILILSNKDLASNYALNMLLPRLSKHHKIHLWLSAKVGNNTALPQQLKTLKFFEQDLFNNLLSSLITASKNSNSYNGFTQLNNFLQSEIKEVNKINTPSAVAELQSLSPDIIVSIRYGGILKEAVINIPPKGVINLHSGILPKYKGVMATFWALTNNEPEIGTTLHTIEDATIDTGHIIKISKIKAWKTKSYLWHVLQLYKQGCADIIETIEIVAKGASLQTFAQDKSQTYYTFPTAKECNDFEESGFTFVGEQDYLAFMQDNYL